MSSIDENNFENFYSDFPVQSYEEWKAEAEASLKGAPFDKKLITKTYEGIDVQPLYTKKDTENNEMAKNSVPGVFPYLRGVQPVKKGWHIAQVVYAENNADFNDNLKKDLKAGQTAINIHIDENTFFADLDKNDCKFHGELSLMNLHDFGTAFYGVDLTKQPLLIQAGFYPCSIVSMLSAYLEKSGVKINNVSGAIVYDPIAYSLKYGKIPYSYERAFDELTYLNQWSNSTKNNFKTLNIDASVYSNGGANAVQEIAYAMATAIEYLRKLTLKELDINVLAKRARFIFGVGSDFFVEISKFRAARVVWAKILEAFGADKENCGIRLHVQSSAFNKSILDQHVNMLRSTSETFSAIVGGANSISVQPFDLQSNMPDEFSRRMARNTQIILNDEARLADLIDPAGGSYFVETLTAQIAERAWALIQDIESKGGMLELVKNGTIQKQVAEISGKRIASAESRKDSWVGINNYPNLKESVKTPSFPCAKDRNEKKKALYEELEGALDVAQLKKALSEVNNLETAVSACLFGANIQQIAKAFGYPYEIQNIEPINEIRISQKFEEMRAEMLAYGEKNGSPIKVFLATMGPLKQHKPRADFSEAFFAVGGFAIERGAPFQSVEEAINAALASKAPIVVICSTDDTYPEIVPEFAKTIKEKNPSVKLILAGFPSDYIDAFKSAGVDDFIHMKANVYQMNKSLAMELTK